MKTIHALTLLFIGLKLSHHIDWSWWWVLSPTILWVSVVGIAVISETVRLTKLKIKAKRRKEQYTNAQKVLKDLYNNETI
jgi:predicted tellurium resistance membrane protein TerC